MHQRLDRDRREIELRSNIEVRSREMDPQDDVGDPGDPQDDVGEGVRHEAGGCFSH